MNSQITFSWFTSLPVITTGSLLVATEIRIPSTATTRSKVARGIGEWNLHWSEIYGS
jgi:hypothetical protein